MKLRLTLMIAALAIPCSGATAQSASSTVAQHGTYGTYGLAPGEKIADRATPNALWRIRMLALRNEALELQRRDGGTLTPEHHAMLQAKLDRINAQAQQN